MWDEDVCFLCTREFRHGWLSAAQRAPYLLVVSPEDGTLAPMFEVWALANYERSVKKIIVAWKHSNSRSLDRVIMGVWRDEVKNVLPPSCESLCVVPAPSRWMRRHDGQLVACKLAQELAEAWGCEMLDALRIRSQRRGRCWLVERIFSCIPGKHSFRVAGFYQRGHKRSGIYARGNLAGMSVVLVDDVITTGATAHGAARAITEAGGRVVGMFTLAVTNRY